MKVDNRKRFWGIFLWAVCLITTVYLTSLRVSATEITLDDVFSEEEDVCLATGAYDKDSVVALDDNEVLPEEIIAESLEEEQTEPEEEISKEAIEPEVTILDADGTERDEDSKAVFAKVSDSVNVREEPSEDSAKVGKLFKNCSGTMLEKQDGWTKISSGDLIGWVSDEYLYFGAEAEQKIEETGALKAIIQTDALRVRKEPDENAGVYKLAKKGDTFTATEELDGWVAIKIDDETTGYVSSEFASVEFMTEKGKTVDEIEEEEKAKEKAKLTKNRGAVSSSVSETALLAALIQAEAGTQSYEGQLAVGAVVMNRVRSPGYPNTVAGVISQPGQFPPATNGTVSAIAARGAKASCVQAAQAAISGQTNVGGALHFGRVGKAAGVVIGGHVFY